MISKKVAAGVVALAVALPSAVGMAPAEAKTATTLSISANRHAFGYGQTLRLSAHINVAGVKVTYYEHLASKSYVTVGPTYASDSHGNVRAISFPVGENATYYASYAGSSAHGAAHASTRITVAAKVITRLGHVYKRKGRYHLVHARKNGVIAAAVVPKKAHHHVKFPLQRYRHGKWRTVVAKTFKLNSKGVVAIKFHGAKGSKYRIRAQYAGDTVNTGGHSGWSYVKFV